jgi:hypothetical protein
LTCALLVVLVAPASAVPPSLRFAGTDPVKVAGRGFPTSVKVRVTLVADAVKTTRLSRSSRDGRFTVTFDVSADRCSGYVVTATGGGTRATAKLAPHECPPPLNQP